MAIYSEDIGLIVSVILLLASIVAGFYGIKIYQATKGGAALFLYIAVFAALAAALGISDILEPIFGADTIMGRAVSKGLENTLVPAISVIVVLIGVELAKFARGE